MLPLLLGLLEHIANNVHSQDARRRAMAPTLMAATAAGRRGATAAPPELDRGPREHLAAPTADEGVTGTLPPCGARRAVEAD